MTEIQVGPDKQFIFFLKKEAWIEEFGAYEVALWFY